MSWWRRFLLLLVLLLGVSVMTYWARIASSPARSLPSLKRSKKLAGRREPGGLSIWIRASLVTDLDTCCLSAGGSLTAVKAGKAKLLTLKIHDSSALSDSRPALQRAAGIEGLAFLAVRRDEQCLEPLSRHEEATTPVSALDSTQVVAADLALLSRASHEHPREGIGHFFWGGHRPSNHGDEAGEPAPAALCRRWVERQRLLRALEANRSFWVNLTGSFFNAVELVGQDVMQYAGWRNTESKRDASLVIRGGIVDEDSFAGAELGKQAFLRHPHVSNITTKDLLFWNLRRHVEEGRSCLQLEDMVPRTWIMDDPEGCRDALQELPLLSTRLPGDNSTGGPAGLIPAGLVRKVGPLHMGKGISMVDGIQAEDEAECRALLARGGPRPKSPSDLVGGGGSRVIYQRRLDTFKILDRSTSIRAYLLVASFSPLVVFFNHVAGHVYLGGVPISSEMAWYTQQRLFSAWTFERLDQHMEEQGVPDFFFGSLYPRMKDILATVVAAMEADNIFASPRVGGLFDLLCADFMLDKDRKVYLLEVSDACMFKGYGQQQEQVRQRVYLMRDALDLALDVSTRVLRREPVLPLLDPGLTAMDGRFELLHFDGGPLGSEKPFRHNTLQLSQCSRKRPESRLP